MSPLLLELTCCGPDTAEWTTALLEPAVRDETADQPAPRPTVNPHLSNPKSRIAATKSVMGHPRSAVEDS